MMLSLSGKEQLEKPAAGDFGVTLGQAEFAVRQAELCSLPETRTPAGDTENHAAKALVQTSWCSILLPPNSVAKAKVAGHCGISAFLMVPALLKRTDFAKDDGSGRELATWLARRQVQVPGCARQGSRLWSFSARTVGAGLLRWTSIPLPGTQARHASYCFQCGCTWDMGRGAMAHGRSRGSERSQKADAGHQAMDGTFLRMPALSNPARQESDRSISTRPAIRLSSQGASGALCSFVSCSGHAVEEAGDESPDQYEDLWHLILTSRHVP